jgi:hypothetical protein
MGGEVSGLLGRVGQLLAAAGIPFMVAGLATLAALCGALTLLVVNGCAGDSLIPSRSAASSSCARACSHF